MWPGSRPSLPGSSLPASLPHWVRIGRRRLAPGIVHDPLRNMGGDFTGQSGVAYAQQKEQLARATHSVVWHRDRGSRLHLMPGQPCRLQNHDFHFFRPHYRHNSSSVFIKNTEFEFLTRRSLRSPGRCQRNALGLSFMVMVRMAHRESKVASGHPLSHRQSTQPCKRYPTTYARFAAVPTNAPPPRREAST